MGKSRAEPVKQMVTESESEEPQEEKDGGSSTEGSESESENQTALAESGKKPVSESSPEEEEEEEDGSESESGSESDGPDVNAQPLLATKSVKSAKPAATPSKPVSLKRAPGEVKENQAKKQKRPEVENSEKKQLFQRLWSEEDEIAILKGMMEYAAKKKADPVADLNAFLEFIKKNIHTDVSKTQLQDKIRRLRKKYENNRDKEKDGKNRTLSKPHEQEAYELSKRVWNGEPKLVGGSVAKGGAKKKKSSKKAVEEEGKDSNFVGDLGRKAVPLIAGGGGTLKERIARMGDEAFKGGQGEGSKQWSSLKVKEVELYMAQLDVKKAQANLVLDLFKS